MFEPKILAFLSRDEVLKSVIDTTTISYQERDSDDVYGSLLRAVIAQQLSAKAAHSIHQRFKAHYFHHPPHPLDLLSTDISTLRSLGLSKAKANYVHNVAMFFHENMIMDLDWTFYSDEYIIDLLTEIKGVGRWTVQMILIFSLHRLDVFPIDDLVIRQNIIKLYQIDETLRGKFLKKELHNVGNHWRPWRSIACRYLWKWGR